MKLMHFSMVVMFSLCLSPGMAEASGDLSVSGTTTTTHLEVNSGNLQQIPGDPALVGSVSVSAFPFSVTVSGRYAYVLGAHLDIVDVTIPDSPKAVGNLVLGSSGWFPTALFVSGRYAYVLDSALDTLRVIDVSDPSSPAIVGDVALGGSPEAIYVSGRYAYVVDAATNDLKVLDVTNPVEPSVVGSLAIGGWPRSIFVSGRYAYIVDSDSDDLRIIDVSNPESPSLVGSFALGDAVPWSVYVSGRYAFVVDSVTDDLKAIDISDPTSPDLADTLPVGGAPVSVFAAGRYIYVVDTLSDDLKIIDASDPAALSQVGSLYIGPTASSMPHSVFVSGRYAYVAEFDASELKVIDISGGEVTSLAAHSLEAGSLQVRNDIVAQGQLQVSGGINVGSGGIFTDGNLGLSGTLAIANDIAPSASPDNLVQLYARDEKSSAELVVLDEAGFHTVLSPHNFSLIGKPSEPMAWSFYSENETGSINVDMLRAIRLVEAISGQKLVHTELKQKLSNIAGSDEVVTTPDLPSIELLQRKLEGYQNLVEPLIEEVRKLKTRNERLTRRVEMLEKKPDS